MVIALFAIAATVFAADWQSEVRALRPKDNTAGETAVLDHLENRAREALARIQHPQAPSKAPRPQLETSLGHRRLPWPPRLNARVVGVVNQPGYRIEKIVWETLPNVRVPAHLYVPDGLQSAAPAVLFYNGHWWQDSKSRPDFQAFCINMARLGFIVLSFDPFGQGERGVSARDHRRTEALLVGVSQQGIAEYETQCALEYLLSRKEVDRNRIGMTGASGGGYNTWITAALDDRIKVAVPVVGTSEFYEQIHVTRPLDWYRAGEHCHFVPGLIRYANNHELVAMIAPRPLMIIAASVDQSFPVRGVREIAEYAKRLYAPAVDRTAYFEDSSEGHGYGKAKREAAYGWFLKWLMQRGDGKPFSEPLTETQPFDASELRCFPGENQPAGPGIIEATRRLVTKELRIEPAKEIPLSTPRVSLSDQTVQRLMIESEPGIRLPVFVAMPQGRAKGLVLGVSDGGKEALASDEAIHTMVERGWAVCGLDPRGIGELAVSKPGWLFAVNLLLGDNFVSDQGLDIRRAAAAVNAIAVYARGHNASMAAMYALAHMKPKWYVLRDGFVSFHHFIDRPKSLALSFRLRADDNREARITGYDREIPHYYFPFGALRQFDLPNLLASNPGRGLVVDPIDGDWDRLNLAVAQRLLPRRARATSGEALPKALDELLKE